jgi:hypothetical protein
VLRRRFILPVAGIFYKEISETFQVFLGRRGILFHWQSQTSESCGEYTVIWPLKASFLPVTIGDK